MKNSVKLTLIDIVKNPLIVGSVLGIGVSLLHIKLPAPVQQGVSAVAGTATPLALLLLGSQIDFKQLSGNIKPALAACLVRLVIVPALVVPLMIVAGFRGPELGALMVAFSAPCAVSSMIMARNYNMDPPFAAQIVYLSTTISIITMFFLISLLRSLEYF
jgi:predicted permease